MILTAKKHQIEGIVGSGAQHEYSYFSGMVSSGRYIYATPPKWSGGYGYYEARIKIPDGQAIWPAFWLLPVDHNWPPEIDIMEVLGNQPNILLNTYFWKNTNRSTSKDSSPYISSENLASGWHIYAVNWQKGSIDWYFDGKLVKHVLSSNVPSTKMQIIFDLAVGGNLPGYSNSSTPNVARMLVDYVRVYDN